jgi:predicted nucleotidyltransferase
MAQAFTFQHRLNPKLWDNDRLKPIVRLKLFQAALAFYKFLDIPRLVVNDIILTGSNAAFNYTFLSDVDVHLIVDFAQTTCPALAENVFTTKKALWGRTYSINVFGCPVELYVEDANREVIANGIFSILHDRWIAKPSAERPEADDRAIAAKVSALGADIQGLLVDSPDGKQIDQMIKRLRAMRQSGLLSGGEFSDSNLAYKVLRDRGLIDRLYDKRIEIWDRALSL